MKIVATNPRLTLDLKGNMSLTVVVGKEYKNALQGQLEGIGDVLSVEIKKYRKERSLDANSYFWVLVHKLSEATGIFPEEIYYEAVKNVGGNCEVIPLKNEAVETWCKNWSSSGLGWLTESLGESKLSGYTNIVNYYGSSTYDTAQMARLIDNIVQDCKAVGVDTATPEEIERLKVEWNDKQN